MCPDNQTVTEQQSEVSDISQRLYALSSQRDETVAKIMTTDVITVAPYESMVSVAQMMSDNGLSCVVVLENHTVVGILTLKDYLFGMAAEPKGFHQKSVGDCMVRSVQYVTPDQTVLLACKIMQQHRIRRLPVLDEGHLVGIVTQTDLTRVLTTCGTLRNIAEIMSTDVETVSVEVSVMEAVQRMSSRRVSCIVVMAETEPVGILTERDVVKKISACARDPKHVPIKEVMSSPVISVDSQYSIHSAGRVMEQQHVHRLVVAEKGQLQGLITQTDIFRAARQMLEAEYEKGLHMLAGSMSSIFILDAQGNTLYVNPACLDMLEIEDPTLLMGNPFLPAPFWDDAKEQDRFIDQLRLGDTDIEQLALNTGRGRRIFVSLVSSLTRDIQGQVNQIQGVMRDITARIEAEQEISEAYDQLRKANYELKKIQLQVVQQEKLASIGQLAAGVAHEMNTPVGFVASNFQTLETYMDRFLKLFKMYETLASAVEDGQKERRLHIFTEIKEARMRMKMDFILDDIQQLFDESREGLERVTTIIQNLKDFSHVDQKQELAEYSLNKGIEATLTVARNEIKYDAELETRLSDIPPIKCYAGQINQVLLNIIVNAAQAIRYQEGRRHQGHITISTSATDSHVVCKIQDNGPGISEDIRQKIFDPFFTTKPPGKGTGLGLNVSYDIIVNKHKGQLEVDTVLGQGTTFIIRLPLYQSTDTDEQAS